MRQGIVLRYLFVRVCACFDKNGEGAKFVIKSYKDIWCLWQITVLLVKVKVDVNGEKELREYKVKDLKFRQRKHRVKLSAEEIKKLAALEDKEGKSKLDDAK